MQPLWYVFHAFMQALYQAEGWEGEEGGREGGIK